MMKKFNPGSRPQNPSILSIFQFCSIFMYIIICSMGQCSMSQTTGSIPGNGEKSSCSKVRDIAGVQEQQEPAKAGKVLSRSPVPAFLSRWTLVLCMVTHAHGQFLSFQSHGHLPWRGIAHLFGTLVQKFSGKHSFPSLAPLGQLSTLN